jgi:hypothetical protein
MLTEVKEQKIRKREKARLLGKIMAVLVSTPVILLVGNEFAFYYIPSFLL